MSNKITIEISTLTGIKRTISIPQTITIDTLKEMIQQEIHVEKELIHLLYKGKGLENEKQLFEYGIENGSKLTFIKLKKTKKQHQQKQKSEKEKERENTIENIIENNQSEIQSEKEKEIQMENNEEIFVFQEENENDMSEEEYFDLSIGEDSIEEILDNLEIEYPEIVQEMRNNPSLFVEMVQNGLKDIAHEVQMEEEQQQEEEMKGYQDEMEELELEENVIDSIHLKIKNDEELTELEYNIINEEDELKVKQYVIQYVLLEEGYPERIVIEASKNRSTVKSAREYCIQYLGH